MSYLLDDGLMQALPEFMAWWIRQLPLHDQQFSFHGFLAFRYIEKELLLKRSKELAFLPILKVCNYDSPNTSFLKPHIATPSIKNQTSLDLGNHKGQLAELG